jgi:hypothetical protein
MLSRLLLLLNVFLITFNFTHVLVARFDRGEELNGAAGVRGAQAPGAAASGDATARAAGSRTMNAASRRCG